MRTYVTTTTKVNNQGTLNCNIRKKVRQGINYEDLILIKIRNTTFTTEVVKGSNGTPTFNIPKWVTEKEKLKAGRKELITLQKT